MGMGWRACALALLLSVVTVSTGEPAPSPEETPGVQPASHFQNTFSAERFSQAYDRVARKEGVKGTDSIPAVTATPSLGLTSLMGKVIFSLLVVVGVIYAASYAAKRWQGGALLSNPGPLKVLARQSVSSKSSVYIVAAMDRFLIIGESPQGLTCLSQFDDAEENKRLRETWGWEGTGARDKNRLYTPRTSPFGPALRSHVEELERELSRFQEVS